MGKTDADDVTGIPTHVPDPTGTVSMVVFGLAVALLILLIIAIALAA